MEYRLTEKGRTAEVKPTASGKILDFMQNGHGVINPHEINYELQMESSQNQLDSLVRAGYLSKEEESQFGSGSDLGI